MKENRYDDPLFFEKYSQMSRSRLGLAGAGEWEDLQKLLPDFAGKQVLDLGCEMCIRDSHEAGGLARVRMREKEEQVMRELGLPASASYATTPRA